MTTPADYADALLAGDPTRVSAQSSALCGRVLRGIAAADFETLTPDPNRRLVFLMGEDGLKTLGGLDEDGVLNAIGYEASFVASERAKGTRFRLAVFTSGEALKLADWDGALDVIAATYPALKDILERQRDALKSTPLAEIVKGAPFDLAEVKNAGTSDPRYTTADRLAESEGTLFDVRAFLWHTCDLRELYAGDGYTRDASGKKGVMEYIAQNIALDQLGPHALVDLDRLVAAAPASSAEVEDAAPAGP